MGAVQEEKKEAQPRKREDQRPQRPREPSGGAPAPPTDSSTFSACPFCHNAILRYHRLPTVTTNVTSIVSRPRRTEHPMAYSAKEG